LPRSSARSHSARAPLLRSKASKTICVPSGDSAKVSPKTGPLGATASTGKPRSSTASGPCWKSAEEYGSALDHYLYIAENNPTADEESKVLARIGWMAYITDQPEAAEDYVLASLRVDPANAEATLYLGFITMYGLGDVEGAIPQLEAALELPNLSPSVVSQVEAALEEARQGGTP